MYLGVLRRARNAGLDVSTASMPMSIGTQKSNEIGSWRTMQKTHIRPISNEDLTSVFSLNRPLRPGPQYFPRPQLPPHHCHLPRYPGFVADCTTWRLRP